jgi:hypothetical protein
LLAVNFGVKEGWLKQEHLKPICRSWDNTPETATHPSAARRCRNLDKCFKEATTKVNNDQSAHNINK